MSKISIAKALLDMEKEGEIYAALARVVISLIILVSVWLSSSTGAASHPLKIIGILYALTSFVGVFFARPRWFHPATVYVFAAIDSSVIAFSLTMLASMHNLALTHEFSIPLFSLAFVVLIHSAMRFRPSIIVFGFIFFVVQLFLFPMLFNVPFLIDRRGQNMMHSFGEKFSDLLLHDVGYLPLLFLFLAAGLLFFIVKRTHQLAELAIIDGQKATQLSRFFSPAVSHRLTSNEAIQNTYGNKQNVAVVFIDIRGFSEISENLQPEQVAELLSIFRSKVCEIVFKYNGTVDKFIGDAVLAIFGSPEVGPDDAKHAIRACLEIQKEINIDSSMNGRKDFPEVSVGIGAHYGEVFSGIIQSGKILEHTVIGDAVNIAERLERLTREMEAKIVVSDNLIQAAGLIEPTLIFKQKNKVQIRGSRSVFNIWYQV